MIKKCGVDYNADKPDACKQTFDDAERMTLCPHPMLHSLTWRYDIQAWEESGTMCSVCNGTGELHVSSDSVLGGMPFRCYVCKGTGEKP